MPIVYRCSRCGFPLYIFVRVGQSSFGIQTPSEVIYMHGGHCPRCGKPLRRPTLHDIRVDIDVAGNAARLLEESRSHRVPLTRAEMLLERIAAARRSETPTEA